MADITMCSGEGCLKKSACYRHTAPQNPWRQSFFMSSPVEADGTCRHFSPNKSHDDGDAEGFGL